VIDLAKKFEDYGVDAILYTDIGRDGMMSGVNIEATVELARAVKIPVIASGGVSSMADIERLCAVEPEGIERRSSAARSTKARSTSRSRRAAPTNWATAEPARRAAAALRRPSVILGPCSPSESSPAWT